MTSRDFCYWLQGFFELEESGPKPPEYALTLNSSQTDMIRKHLAMVFKHEIDPSMGDKKHQAELDALHDDKPLKLKPHAGGSHDIKYRC